MAVMQFSNRRFVSEGNNDDTQHCWHLLMFLSEQLFSLSTITDLTTLNPQSEYTEEVQSAMAAGGKR